MMSNVRLLNSYEIFDYTPELIKESIEKNGKIMLKGVLQKSDALNQNGRIYPAAVLEREVRNYQKFIIENRAMGELDHPDATVVNLKNVSHIIREAYIDNGVVYGTLEVLDKTPSGAILKGLIESNVKLGISSRGVGSLRKQGDYHVVQDDFQLICWDMVSEPSTTGAFMLPEGKLIESFDVRNIFNKNDRINRIVNDILV